MAGDRGNFGDVQAKLEQPADSFVAQIMKVEVIQSCADAKVLKTETNRIRRHRKYLLSISTLASHQFFENRYRAGRQWNVAGVAILGQGQMSDAADEVDMLPLWVEHFAPAHRGLHCENDQ